MAFPGWHPQEAPHRFADDRNTSPVSTILEEWPKGAALVFREVRGLPHQQRRHDPSDNNPDAAAQADRYDTEVTEQERLQERKRQLAQAMHNSKNKCRTDDNKKDTTLKDHMEGEQIES